MPLADAVVNPGAKSFTLESAALAAYATAPGARGGPAALLAEGVGRAGRRGRVDAAGVLRKHRRLTQSRAPALPRAGVGFAKRDEHVRARDSSRARACAGASARSVEWWNDRGELHLPIRAVRRRSLEVRTGRPRKRVRGGGSMESRRSTATNGFRRACSPRSIRWRSGTAFRATMHDTWIRTARPEDQKAPWTFVSPTGARHQQMAKYDGDYNWSVEFVPDEIGCWHYSWSQTFAELSVRKRGSEVRRRARRAGRRDRAASRDRQAGCRARAEKRKDDTARLMGQFARLERATMQTMTPESFAAASGESLKAALREARVAWATRNSPTRSRACRIIRRSGRTRVVERAADLYVAMY